MVDTGGIYLLCHPRLTTQLDLDVSKQYRKSHPGSRSRLRGVNRMFPAQNRPQPVPLPGGEFKAPQAHRGSFVPLRLGAFQIEWIGRIQIEQKVAGAFGVTVLADGSGGAHQAMQAAQEAAVAGVFPA